MATKEDLESFKSFLLTELDAHKSSLTSLFKESSDSAEQALTLSKQLKTESEVKLIHPDRNRKIRIADSSEGGWATVKHYEGSPVAIDQEDDKKIRAAEREALREKTRANKHKYAEKPSGRGRGAFAPYNRPSFDQRAGWSGRQPSYQQYGSSFGQQRPNEQQRGSCRYCGAPGHWWRDCPVRIAKSFPQFGTPGTTTSSTSASRQ
ncbi:uncharacterized protein LOC116611462 [Nematostella vectensis]|uniref:uncharacterized protein LOC116611462 n=1 Tax=Nematostella vectensis TaxID=45351 RepID=UPI002077895C|nr:uncharacterized protein LOC116611462 [Nematostella vectensis]